MWLWLLSMVIAIGGAIGVWSALAAGHPGLVLVIILVACAAGFGVVVAARRAQAQRFE